MADHKCDQAIAKVYDYLDDEMTWYRKVRIRYHLRRCPPCEVAFVFETRLREVVRERSQDECPAELLEKLHRMLREAGAGSEA